MTSPDWYTNHHWLPLASYSSTSYSSVIMQTGAALPHPLWLQRQFWSAPWLPPPHTINDNCNHNSDHGMWRGWWAYWPNIPNHPWLTPVGKMCDLFLALYQHIVPSPWHLGDDLSLNFSGFIFSPGTCDNVRPGRKPSAPHCSHMRTTVMLPRLWRKVLWRGPVVDVTND